MKKWLIKKLTRWITDFYAYTVGELYLPPNGKYEITLVYRGKEPWLYSVRVVHSYGNEKYLFTEYTPIEVTTVNELTWMEKKDNSLFPRKSKYEK